MVMRVKYTNKANRLLQVPQKKYNHFLSSGVTYLRIQHRCYGVHRLINLFVPNRCVVVFKAQYNHPELFGNIVVKKFYFNLLRSCIGI